ncbi:methyl-accepting chemotaxis protein [Massilia sp. NR 4-1]|uniref:methyl-accepting chemotaxis protein n=1 Tax=Massilia sp. NR 4-1 TaxID=1678028 RepID=UPI00067B5AAF|nr:methyl-accepting chemotaxis protein [Massilia sp. NR 4-1]
MNIANIKIGHRLTIAFLLTIFALALVVGVGATALKIVSGEIEQTIGQRYQNISVLNQLKTALNLEARSSANALLAEQPADLERELAQIAATKRDAGEALSQAAALLQTEQAKTLYAAIGAERAKYETARESLLAQLRGAQREAALALMTEQVRPAQRSYFAAVDALIDFQASQMQTSGRSAEDLANQSALAMVALGVVGGILSLLTAWYITRGIVRPIGHAVKVARTVAAGDLTSTIEVRSRDEVGQLTAALRDMNASLLKIVGEVRQGSDSIGMASAEIAAGNQDLSNRTEQQAASLEEASSSMAELTSTVKRNAESAHQANELAAAASEVAGKGGAVVAQVVERMASINASSHKIVDIISVIDSIAFQTNILALNAAVEAARAGEQGRGFAVVAGEVRNLAQRSSAAAHEIKNLIDDSVDQIASGAKLVDQAGGTMHEIMASVQRVTGIMAEISEASREQLSGIEQINHAVAGMDQGTQQNAALVEQASAAAITMRQQAEHLATAVGVFRLAADGLVGARGRMQRQQTSNGAAGAAVGAGNDGISGGGVIDASRAATRSVSTASVARLPRPQYGAKKRGVQAAKPSTAFEEEPRSA